VIALHIARRELRAWLRSPFAWLVAGTFLMIHGMMFTVLLGAYLRLSQKGPGWAEEGVPVLQGLIEPLFSTHALLLILFVPLLTMRSLAAEQRAGTMPLLLSSPLSTLEVVLGKWIGLVGFLLALVFVGTAYGPIAIAVFGDPPVAASLSAALGLALLAGAASALGLACSSVTDNQLLAAVLAWTLLLGLWMLAVLEGTDGVLAVAAEQLSLLVRVKRLGQGLVRLSDLVWFVGFTTVCLAFAWQQLESRRWR